jgi:hypothetical protein
MKDNIGELVTTTTTTKTFRFASGQLLILDDHQVEKIPYLAAIVSSADNFESVCDEHGHFKLDPYIEFKYFPFVIKSLSFRLVRQIFTHLPKEDDIIEIIALFDFLGIGLQSDPTLDEVDSTFFSNLVYSPLLDTYLQIIKPSILRDMAVRFGIAIIKEQYDFTNRQVIDQIYWYIMFILSTPTLFGPGLRHHMYKIAEYCFSLFSPCLLKPLERLLWTTIQCAKKKKLFTNLDNISLDKQNEYLCGERLYDRFNWVFNSRCEIARSRRSILNRASSRDSHWLMRLYNEEALLKPLCDRIVETMYERLQSEICQHAKAEIHRRRQKCIQKENYEWILTRILEREIVQEEICKSVSDKVCKLIPYLESMHRFLIEQNQWSLFRLEIHIFEDPYEIYVPSREDIQSIALFYEIMLDKLRQHSLTIEEQIRQDIVKTLHDVALKQITEWENTEKEIVVLQQILSIWRSPEKLFHSILTPIRYKHWISAKRPLPKIQRKYSTR